MGQHFSVSELSNHALLERAMRLASNDRAGTVSLIVTLREIDSRRLYLSEGHSLIAGRHPKPDVPTVVRKQSEARRPVVATGGERTLLQPDEMNASAAQAEIAPAAQPVVLVPPIAPALPAKPSTIAPLSPARYKVQFTADQDTHDKLRRAQALLRHQFPSGDVGAIISKALALLIADVERKKLGLVARPRKVAPKLGEGSRHIPAKVRRAVWKRDQAQCAFIGARGRCDEQEQLEFHHVVPFAAGGTATVDNIQVRCRAHNAHEAVLYFGEDALPARAGRR